MTWVDKLVREYAAGKRELVAYRKKLENTDRSEAEEMELETVKGMISDLQYGIDWMRSGRRPGSVRGYDSHDAYRFAELRDMDLLPALDLSIPEPPRPELTADQKLMLVNVLLKLSARERQCFLMHAVQRMSEREIADELKVSRRSVRIFIERARDKVQQAI
ncbi:sigma-70 family RNA polymerase sigma factor [Paenibacillus sp. HJGM_3]|uniref:sigma-70 family RNA polymerase sigma factor n=1 Tax=Paenibacillus sp. HJGM_3 TaxID=3379816 RepID=UPI00385AA267